MNQYLGESGQLTTPIHFFFASGGGHRIACMPGLTEFHQTPQHPHYHRTDDARAVTCLSCKKTAVYKAVGAHGR